MQWMTQMLLILTNSTSDIESVSLESKCSILCDNLSSFTEEITK